jgi:hypothetical protein
MMMRKLAFYRQQRRDGGIRTAIDVNDEAELGRFENEADFEHTDPVLAWWVDVRCEGPKLPTDPEKARQWFLDQADVIRRGLQTLAGEMKAGIDFDNWPVLWPVPKPPRGVRMIIACSASRRPVALEMPRILTDIAEHWEERVRNLGEVERLFT